MAVLAGDRARKRDRLDADPLLIFQRGERKLGQVQLVPAETSQQRRRDWSIWNLDRFLFGFNTHPFVCLFNSFMLGLRFTDLAQLRLERELRFRKWPLWFPQMAVKDFRNGAPFLPHVSVFLWELAGEQGYEGK